MTALNVKVIGVGGAGINMAGFVQAHQLPQVTCAGLDCDVCFLEQSSVSEKLYIGHNLSRGLSTGGDADLGKKMFLEDLEKIEALVSGVDLLFIFTGLGGGFGTTVAPLLAELAGSKKTLVFNFCTLPFNIEGRVRYQLAQSGLTSLQKVGHITVPLPNDILLQNLKASETVAEAFNLANDWAFKALHSIVSILYQPGLINLDFASLMNLFGNVSGKSLFGLAQAQGEGYVQALLDNLQICPLLHTPQATQMADDLLINFIGGKDLSLKDVNYLAGQITARFKAYNNTQIGAVIDETKEQYLEAVVIGAAAKEKKSNTKRKTSSKVSYNNAYQQDLFAGIDLTSSDPIQVATKPESRGYFSETDKTIYNGEDLDIPTYLRKAIQIVL